MTFTHFLNCAILTFGPIVVTYKACRLADYQAFWTCGYAAMAYGAALLIKMITIATFLPTGDETGTFDLSLEAMKGFVNLVDIGAVYYTLSYLVKGEKKIIGVGLGWAFAESLCIRLIPLWFGARGTEFQWQFIQMALYGNVNIVLHLAFVSLVWLWGRRNLSSAASPLVTVGVLSHAVLIPAARTFLESVTEDQWVVFAVYTAIVVAYALFTHLTYSSHQQGKVE